jgi:biotin-[acetyl-CoA-carboxylase] ligase BirA-like protein
MKILTDSPEFANNFLKSDFIFQKCSENTVFSLFFNKLCFISEISDIIFENFDVLIINKFSEFSQFDILNQIDTPSNNILCFSDSGNEFHGFKNRKWETLSGNFHLSFKIIPKTNFDYIYQAFTIIAANSVVKTIKKITDLKPGIKWVNDIMINNAKVGGIITKTKSQQLSISEAIFGIGVNINNSPNLLPDKFIKKATHLNNFGYNISPFDFLNEFIKSLNFFLKYLEKNDYDYLFDYYDENSIIKNKYIKIFEDNDEAPLLYEGIVYKINKDLTLKIIGIDEKVSKGRIGAEFFYKK